MPAAGEPARPAPRDDHRKIDLDTILVNEIGQFGRFQLRVLLLAVVVVIFAAWGASEYVFTTSRINTRCRIPQCDVEEPEYSPEWILNAVPGTAGSLDNCQRYGNASAAGGAGGAGGACPAALFDRGVLEPCEEYVYENTHTVVYDWDMLGSESGRRGSLTCWFVLAVIEVVGPQYRVVAGATMNTFFSVGQISMGLVAWAVPDWRLLTVALYAPQLLTVAYFWIMTESVRWYMSKGRYEESEALLQHIAGTNGKQLSPKSLADLRRTAEEDKLRKELEKIEKVNEPGLILLLFRHKKILLRCLVSPVWWITTTFIYYGMSINSVNMSGNRYVNYVAVSAVEIPGYWTAVLLMARVGRRPVLIAAFWVCAACQLAYIFLPSDMYAASLSVYLVGKYSIAMVMTSVYVYTAELYPTKYRHSLFAFSSMMGRIGSVVAPLTPAFGAATFDEMPFVLFGSFALLAGALIFLTPETLGCKLPDTMEEAENIGVNRTKT